MKKSLLRSFISVCFLFAMFAIVIPAQANSLSIDFENLLIRSDKKANSRADKPKITPARTALSPAMFVIFSTMG